MLESDILGAELEALGADGDTVIELIDHGANLRRERIEATNGAEPTRARQLVNGATFVLDTSAEVEAVWGESDGRVLWASGEPLILVAPQGVGKTTFAQRLTLGRIGLCPKLLSMPVASDERRVLYIAADRPRQAQRSFARMVSDVDCATLAERLEVWRGPLPFSVVAEPWRFVELCESAGAGTIVVDSLKDIASDLSREETGQAIALAMQELVAAEIEVLILHHQRKAQSDNKSPKSLSDVYGSGWITAGAGSVVLLWGEPGDPLIELRHLKQPAEEVGPLKITHDQVRGLPTLQENSDIEDTLRRAGVEGVTVADAAKLMFSKTTPTRNEIEKARRRLEGLVKRGLAVHLPSLVPTNAGSYVYDGPGSEERERA